MKYIIFDIDGTLTDTTQVDDKCYMSAFETTFGVNIENTDWGSMKNVTDWGIAEEIVKIKFNRDIKNEELRLLKETFVKALQKELALDKSQFVEIAGAAFFFTASLTIWSSKSVLAQVVGRNLQT